MAWYARTWQASRQKSPFLSPWSPSLPPSSLAYKLIFDHSGTPEFDVHQTGFFLPPVTSHSVLSAWNNPQVQPLALPFPSPPQLACDALYRWYWTQMMPRTADAMCSRCRAQVMPHIDDAPHRWCCLQRALPYLLLSLFCTTLSHNPFHIAFPPDYVNQSNLGENLKSLKIFKMCTNNLGFKAVLISIPVSFLCLYLYTLICSENQNNKMS